MNKRAYYNHKTQELDSFNRVDALQLGPDWEAVPEMENFINDDGKHQIRLHFTDFTVDITETDQTYDPDDPDQSIISTEGGEDVNTSAD